MITFTPLSGSARSTHTTPLAYLLQVDDVRILLDCGSPDWRPEPSTSTPTAESYPWEDYCNALRDCAPTVDLVLLSHGDLAHAGLYPYACCRWGLKAPTYSTLPIQAMARIAVGEDVEGIREEEDVGGGDADGERQPAEEMPDGDEWQSSMREGGGSENGKGKGKGKFVATVFEVHEAFDSVNVLRYSQPTHLQGKCQGLTITPFNAGHTLGGTIWKIRSPSAGTIVYAVNLNHMRERHLDGTVLWRPSAGTGVFEPLVRPDLLITDAERVSVASSKRKDRDATLLDCITATLTSRSSLLLPCDASTRILELLVLLDQHWSYSRLKYPICLLSRTGEEMLTFVRSMMEWLGGTVNKEDVGGEGPGGSSKNSKRKRDDNGDEDALGAFALRFRHLEFFASPQALMHTYSSKDPKLILAVPASLSHGPSRTLFADFASVPGNVVLLTQRGEDGTLGKVMFDKWNDAQRSEDKWDKGRIGSNVMMDGSITLKMYSKVPLQGSELEEYLQKERAEKEKEAAQKAVIDRNQRIFEADEDEDESDSEGSDSDEENEVERALGGGPDTMDASDDPPPDGGRKGRKKGNGSGGGAGGDDWGGLDAADDGLSKHLSFDIYLKGNVSRATSFFKTADGQTQRFRMFPYIEKKRRVDEYGETIDVGMWLRTSKAFEEAENEESKDRKRTVEDETKKVVREPPSKFVTSEIDVQLACRLLFVDLEGLNDGRAVKTIVPQVHPRKMIIVHAASEATDALIESCGNIRAMTKDIYAPAQQETVQIGQHTNSFSISLSDDMLASIKMSRFEDNEVGYVTGRVSSLATSTIPVLEPATVATPAMATPTGSNRLIGSRPTATLPKSTMIGELKLTSLKARLSAIGVQAELVGEGVLICGAAASKKSAGPSEILDNSVAVRKTARGKVELEGTVSEVYYIVRKEIYNLYALVAA